MVKGTLVTRTQAFGTHREVPRHRLTVLRRATRGSRSAQAAPHLHSERTFRPSGATQWTACTSLGATMVAPQLRLK